MIEAFWHRSPPPGNLGDVLAPVILGRLGVDVEWAPKQSATLLATGSVIDATHPGSVVWGSGAMRRDSTPDPAATYLAVRGPITRRLVLDAGGECPEVYGDPAILLPWIDDTAIEVEHEIGIVPHYVDLLSVRDTFADFHIISPLAEDSMEVVREIRRCEAVMSSSLHGLIVAHAYGIPAARVDFGGVLKGDGTKFDDYAMSFGEFGVPKLSELPEITDRMRQRLVDALTDWAGSR